jgi:hypothetical protein
MKKNLLILISLITFGGSISAMENNNPGDAAIKDHPNAWLATKVAGGTTGGFLGLTGVAAWLTASDIMGSVIGRAGASPARKRLEQLKFLSLSIPVTYIGWKGGEAASKALWYRAWNGIDKIQRFKESIKK